MKRVVGLLICVSVILLCAFALADVAINEENFPDESHLNYVLAYDSDKDGFLNAAELAALQSNLSPITLYSGNPQTCVFGEDFQPFYSWWNAFGKSTWTMNIFVNGDHIASFDSNTGTNSIHLGTEGICVVEFTVMDAVQRVASVTDTIRIIQPSPLTVNSLTVTSIVENGPGDHNVSVKLDYTGGIHTVEKVHYQIFAMDAWGKWFMTWEDDYSSVKEEGFWLGEDGYHFFKAKLSDGVSTVEVSSDIFLVGKVPEPPVPNGLVLDDDGVWRYYENGVFVEKTGIVDFEGGRFFVANGLLCSDVDGLAEFGGQWYFLAGGQIQTQYTGLALYDGQWFYVTNGLFDPGLNGLVDHDGSKFIVAAGQVIRGINGLWQNVDGSWYYLADSQVVTYYTGLVEYDGAWFYVQGGRLATEYTGIVVYNSAEFLVINGQVV